MREEKEYVVDYDALIFLFSFDFIIYWKKEETKDVKNEKKE